MKKTVTARPYKGQKGVWEADILLYFKHGRAPARYRLKSEEKTEKGCIGWGYEMAAELEEQLREEIRVEGRPLTAKERKGLQRAKEESITLRPHLTVEKLSERYLKDYVEVYGVANTYRLRDREITAHLLPLFGQVPIDQINKVSFAQLLGAIAKTRKRKKRCPAQVNRVMWLLWHMLFMAKEWGLLLALPEKPKRLPEPAPEIELYSAEEYDRLVVGSEKVGWQAKLLVLLCGDAGLRVGELLALSWDDLDLKAGYVLVRTQETPKRELTRTKSKKSRRLKLTGRLLTALEKAQHLGEGRRVLVKSDGTRVSRATVSRWLLSAERRAGIVAAKSPHKLRHSLASRLDAAGVAVKTIQEILGHSSMQTTLKYVHGRAGEADRALSLLGDAAETPK